MAWDLQSRQGWAKALGAIEPSYPNGHAGNQPESGEERLVPRGHSVERGFSGTGQSRCDRVRRGLKFRKSAYWPGCILVWRQGG